MKIIDAKQCTAIALGRLGENDYTVVRFDVSAWLNELPGAVIGLYNQRPGDGAAYPVAGITVEGGIATWTVTSAELTQTGEGKCELVAIAGEVVAKSAIFRTIVFDALDGSGEAPEPWEEWQQQLIILKNEAEQAADRAEEAVEHYPRIVDGVWEVWDGTTEQWVSTGVQAQGPQGETGERGETGDPGPRGETGEPGVDGVTFTPSVSANGVISWTNDGSLPNPQPVNIKGPAGKDGSDGNVGATPNLTIGTVETLEPGADATAEITGTPENPVLNLGIPQGEKGKDADISNLAPIIINSASGDIASFSDGAEDMPVKALTVNVEPVQDLHGYDSPWPAGGGVNKANLTGATSLSAYNLTTSFDTENEIITISGTINKTNTCAQYRFAEFPNIQNGLGLKAFNIPASASVYVENLYWDDSTQKMVVVIRGLTAGETNTLNVKFQMVAYEGDTAPTAWTPYSNICPISGHDSVNVWDDPVYGGTIKWNQLTVDGNFQGENNWKKETVDSKVTIANGIATVEMLSGSPSIFVPAIAPVSKPPTTITGHKYLFTLDWKGTKIGEPGFRTDSFGGTFMLTNYTALADGWRRYAAIQTARSEKTAYWYLGWARAGAIGVTVGDYFSVKNINYFDLTEMFGAGNEPSTVEEFKALFPNDYYPFDDSYTETCVSAVNGDPYRQVEVSFPTEAGTVYGGTLDVTNGVLTVDRAMVDMGTLVYNKTLSPSASGGNVFSVNVSNVGYGMARRERNAPNTMLSDVYETAQSTIWWVSDIPDLTMSVNVSVLYIADSRYEDATSFKTSVSGVQLVYELATPMTYQLTPQEVRTLLGQNNLWADTGDVAVTYKADTKLYIDNKITQAIAAAMNS